MLPKAAGRAEMQKSISVRNYYLDRVSALDIKEASTQRFGHGKLIKTCSLHLINLLSNFKNLFSCLGITGPK